MINLRYKNAYKEVLEIIKYLPPKDFCKIPKEKIEYFQRNQNIDYDFCLDASIPLEKQKISREANAIILNLFKEYFIADKQKVNLLKLLDINEKEYNEKQKEKYNPDNIFDNSEKIDNEKSDSKNLPTEVYKENIFIKIIQYLKRFFNKNKER